MIWRRPAQELWQSVVYWEKMIVSGYVSWSEKISQNRAWTLPGVGVCFCSHDGQYIFCKYNGQSPAARVTVGIYHSR